ncbi:MAG: 5'/3'-nucleotidase SurE [Deltaproteobacteria bacterium]|nr:5'/3'-nucleotidase SurE [Deltaproteobacteria bacterium]
MSPLILLSNDDGYDAEGLTVLRAALARFADVIVSAPKNNQSAASHALTLRNVLHLETLDDTTFTVDGTPADSVYVALHSGERLLPRWPDMVVSGMNRGPNLGLDVIYSGTVAAAREGALRGIPAVALSASPRAKLQSAVQLAARIVERALATLAETPEDQTPLLNVNIPRGDGWTLQATRLGRRNYRDDIIYRRDPRNREYLWIGGAAAKHDLTAGTDTAAWDMGNASLTPLTLSFFAPEHADFVDQVAAAVDADG